MRLKVPTEVVMRWVGAWRQMMRAIAAAQVDQQRKTVRFAGPKPFPRATPATLALLEEIGFNHAIILCLHSKFGYCVNQLQIS